MPNCSEFAQLLYYPRRRLNSAIANLDFELCRRLNKGGVRVRGGVFLELSNFKRPLGSALLREEFRRRKSKIDIAGNSNLVFARRISRSEIGDPHSHPPCEAQRGEFALDMGFENNVLNEIRRYLRDTKYAWRRIQRVVFVG